MTGESKPGDAVADKWRDRFEKARRESDISLTKLEVRADLKSSGEEELSDVIERETLQRRKAKEQDSEPPASKASPMVIVLTVAKKFPAWGAVIVALAGIAAWVAVKLLAK